MAKTHTQLDALAAEHGFEWPAGLKTVAEKEAALVEAGIGQEAKARTRTFQVRDDGQEDGVQHVSVGADPRVSIALGETFATDDEQLAARLARDPQLEEVTR